MVEWSEILGEFKTALRIIHEQKVILDRASTPKCWALLVKRCAALKTKTSVEWPEKEAHTQLWRAHLADALPNDVEFAEWVAVVE